MIAKLQEKINAEADEKLRDFIRERMDRVRDLASEVLKAYPGSNLSPTAAQVAVESTVTPIINGKLAEVHTAARVFVGYNFYDALEQAMFLAARDAAREMETAEFYKKMKEA